MGKTEQTKARCQVPGAGGGGLLPPAKKGHGRFDQAERLKQRMAASERLGDTMADRCGAGRRSKQETFLPADTTVYSRRKSFVKGQPAL